jgi:GcrA cell cycle regulator
LGGGRSRSSIIGKIHRLGLAGRGLPKQSISGKRYGVPGQPQSLIRNRQVRVKPRRQALAALAPELEALRLPDGARIGTMDLKDCHCRWPHGDVGSPDFHYCGHPPLSGQPYCAHHQARAVARSRPQADPAKPERQRTAEAFFARMWG